MALEQMPPYHLDRNEVKRLAAFSAKMVGLGVLVVGVTLGAEKGIEALGDARQGFTPLKDRTEGVEPYTVGPGETAWDIAKSRLQGTDIRPYVDDIEAQHPGTLRRGEQVIVPVDQDPNE